MRIIAVLIQIALALPAFAGQDEVLVRVETALGTIDIAVDAKHAPITAANFLTSMARVLSGVPAR